MPVLTAEVLRAWRAGERLLELLPAASPDHEAVRLLVAELGELYGQISSSTERSNELVRASLATVQAAWAVLEQADRRIADRQQVERREATA